jgi:hypothetical protein
MNTSSYYTTGLHVTMTGCLHCAEIARVECIEMDTLAEYETQCNRDDYQRVAYAGEVPSC